MAYNQYDKVSGRGNYAAESVATSKRYDKN